MNDCEALKAERDAWCERHHALLKELAAGRALLPAPAIVVQLPPQMPRDREADRARFPDPDFNRWLDESVTENAEFTVWHMLTSVADAWAGWNCRGSYVEPAAPIEPMLIRDLARELGVDSPALCAAIAARGLGNLSVNMAVTREAARAMREQFSAHNLPRDPEPPRGYCSPPSTYRKD